MITCHFRYVVDPDKLPELETYFRMWMRLIPLFGGVHHGYLMPSEGANNIALGSFSFPSLADYEQYRIRSFADPECQAAFQYARDTRCFLSYERSFFRPLMPDA
jgi:NIPSNAP